MPPAGLLQDPLLEQQHQRPVQVERDPHQLALRELKQERQLQEPLLGKLEELTQHRQTGHCPLQHNKTLFRNKTRYRSQPIFRTPKIQTSLIIRTSALSWFVDGMRAS
ncbi:hypothetical protein ISCGN_001424 [Ixodes scapularis]